MKALLVLLYLHVLHLNLTLQQIVGYYVTTTCCTKLNMQNTNSSEPSESVHDNKIDDIDAGVAGGHYSSDKVLSLEMIQTPEEQRITGGGIGTVKCCVEKRSMDIDGKSDYKKYCTETNLGGSEVLYVRMLQE